MTPVLVFDIETIPDVAGLRRLRAEWRDLADAEVAECAFEERRGKSSGEFLPLYLQRIVAISCVLRNDAGFRVGSIGGAGDSEATLIQSFFGMIDRHTPQLVSWNGSCFDLPVLHYRGLLARVPAARYWELGADDPDFRYNNYIGRYHTRHIDLMDVLAMYQSRASAPLDVLSKLAGYPGKLGMDGSQVWQAYRDGQIEKIRSYCETDVVNTYLLFNRFQKMRGVLDDLQLAAEEALVRDSLQGLSASHWREYLDAWPAAVL
ncbi:MAG: 3'-5' exonuclease [Burkholderiaceae bacterium]